eukprot:s391_g3.t1
MVPTAAHSEFRVATVHADMTWRTGGDPLRPPGRKASKPNRNSGPVRSVAVPHRGGLSQSVGKHVRHLH